MVALDVVGSNVDDFECPWCGCNDRDRHLLLFLDALKMDQRFMSARVLHFAPEKAIQRYIDRLGPQFYLTADISQNKRVSVQMNMEKMPIESNSIDVLLANHVLEHVANLPAALSEIYRVVTPGGIAILQTPFSNMLVKTFEDEGVSTEEGRLHAYGQEDHVRLFGRDICEIFCSTGLKSQVRTHTDLLAHVDKRQWGINPCEPLFLFEKPTV